MGQGDRKPAVRPEHAKVRCVKCGYAYSDISVRQCSHPAVRRTYADGGEAHICCYCCRRCKYLRRSEFTSAAECGYGV